MALLLLASGCASDGPGEDVAADVPEASIPPLAPLAEIECPPIAERPSDGVDPRIAVYDDVALAGFVTQRERYDLCPVPAGHLFDDPRTVGLYEQYGVVILAEEESVWIALRERTRESSDAVESIKGEPGFLLARADPASGTYTVFATAAGRASFEPLLAGRDIASVTFETVLNDLAAMEAAERSIVAALPPRLQEAVEDTEMEPDRVVLIVEEGHPLVDEIIDGVDGGEAQARARSALVFVEVRVEPPSRKTTDL